MNTNLHFMSLAIVSQLFLMTGCSFQGSTFIGGRNGKVSNQSGGPNQSANAGADGNAAQSPDGTDPRPGEGQAGGDPGDGTAGGSGPAGPDGAGGQDGTGNPSLPSGTDPASLGLVESLIWKRYRPFEAGLMQALELTKAQVCQELGQFPCIDTVHLTVLGGNEPFINGQHERADRPTVLTPLTTERVVLAACTQRLALDKAAPAQKAVFKHFDLSAGSVTEAQLKNQIIELYQRFYSRDPTEQEITMALEIGKILTAPEKLAVGLCYAIGSTIENVFL